MLQGALPEFPEATGATAGAYFYEIRVYGRPGSTAELPFEEAMLRYRELQSEGSVLLLDVDRGGRVTAARRGTLEEWGD